MMDTKKLWEAVLAQIQLNISEANFSTWFKNTKILEKKENKVIISTPSSFVKEWLENKYQKLILSTLHSLDQEIKKVIFVVGKSIQTEKTSTLPFQKEGQLEFEEFQRNKKTGLNSRYTFENFVVGSFNELAHAAAQAVSENSGQLYNPLFIYGKVGLGKTHLLQAIGNKVFKDFPNREVRYIPAERFISGIVASIRNKTIEDFKNSYQKIDVLIVDDVQFFTRKEKTQEEFFHLFNSLYLKNKQIVLSSDRPPKAIPDLTERLRSRFEGGMIVDIGYPDFETRIAILKAKAQERNVDFKEEIYNFLAEKIQTNIRELEGALSKFILYQQTKNQKITLSKAKSILKEFIFSPLQKNTPKKIIKTVADFYDLRETDLFSSTRRKEVVKPRQIAMYLLKKELRCSYPFIARIFGNKDHTTAIYSVEKIEKEIEKNEILERNLNLIKIRLANP